MYQVHPLVPCLNERTRSRSSLAQEETRRFANLWSEFHRAAALYLVQIFLPRADNSGRPFPQQDFEKFKEELAREFQGVTAYLRAPAEGLWRQENESCDDDIVIFEVMADEIDMQGWQNRRAELERRFRQDEVMIRYMTVAIV